MRPSLKTIAIIAALPFGLLLEIPMLALAAVIAANAKSIPNQPND